MRNIFGSRRENAEISFLHILERDESRGRKGKRCSDFRRENGRNRFGRKDGRGFGD